jgi:hypothetical protein
MINWLKESEHHQHENGQGWIANTAKVEKTVYVGPNAQVYGYARVSGYAQVYGDAQVYGYARVSGDAQVYGYARVSGDARVSGNARVYGDAQVYGYARVSGDARVSGGAWEQSPLYIQGSRHSVTNTSHGKLSIGCITLTFKEWKKQFRAIGKREGYTPAQIKEYGAIIALATKIGK